MEAIPTSSSRHCCFSSAAYVMALHPIHEANRRSPYGDLTREEFYHSHMVHHHESFVLNRHNMKIFTQSWSPAWADPADGGIDDADDGIRGLVAMVHGYTAESGWMFELTAVAVAKLGFHVVALDLRGHGRSEGRRGHLPDIGIVVDDCAEFFDSARTAHEGLPSFLYGESLGGAVAALVYMKQKGRWSGLVLNGAMCGVSSKLKPPWPLEKLLPAMAFVAPDWPVPTRGLPGRSFKVRWKRRLFRSSPNRRRLQRPPASTALELVRVVEEIGRRAEELDLPLLVVHGGADEVCDAGSAERLYKASRSVDKTLRVLPGMWHQLIGEPDEGVDLAFGIIFWWLIDRADRATTHR
ncbi:hypothetical protein Taro_054988 [Colocasia esculenta]|uniref:Serine aminopeptidase S33 domain-containing protein n=1 Tax=Colocasia esculenta TaxID=4460 RepID=A0A843XS83_COLES|nr:hypothetical protein [Colocasia esculenta]